MESISYHFSMLAEVNVSLPVSKSIKKERDKAP